MFERMFRHGEQVAERRRGDDRSGRERCRHGDGFEGRGRGGIGRIHGGWRERLFDYGDVKLVILKLLSEQPSYGYQLMKTMESRLAGGYTPSAGAIYPTLTLLEEEGLTTATMESNRKVYSVTPEGEEFLKANERRVQELFERLAEAGKDFERSRSPQIMKAFENLRGAVVARVARQNAPEEMIAAIAEAIDEAAKKIDAL